MVEKFKSLFYYNRDTWDNILDDPNSKAWKFFDSILLFLVLIFPVVLVFESIWNNLLIYYQELFYFDIFVSTIFLLEYIYRFLRVKNKWTFLISPIRIIDLLSFLPFFLWFVATWGFLKVLRILRILRILKLIKEIPLTAGFFRSIKDYTNEYKAVFTLYFIILILGSFLVYYLEKDVIWTRFTSIFEALWWGIVTMATVWYWDMYPVTTFWKIAWSLLVFLWPLIWALIWAITIMVFMETSINEELYTRKKRLKECRRCKSNNPKEANFCMRCWEEYLSTHQYKTEIEDRF